MKLSETIRAYHESDGKHRRYRSWEHCFRHFQRNGPEGVRAEPEQAALHLGFYLASWGMYRGSSFLLQFTYTVHLPVVRAIASKRFVGLWGVDIGSDPSHTDEIPVLLNLLQEVREAYQPFASENGSRSPTDTLVTKVILGTLGCTPACDEFFKRGLKEAGIPFSAANRAFLDRMLDFCVANLEGLQKEQTRIAKRSGVKYPLMKLVDMHFWRWGFDTPTRGAS